LQDLTKTQENLVEYVNESDVKLCALGADATELERYGLKADITPVEVSVLIVVPCINPHSPLGKHDRIGTRTDLTKRIEWIKNPLSNSIRSRSVFLCFDFNLSVLLLIDSGGLKEPVIVPRFLRMLRKGGADVTPLDAYITQMGYEPKDCIAERRLLQEGFIDAIVFTSSAEVIFCLNYVDLKLEYRLKGSFIL